MTREQPTATETPRPDADEILGLDHDWYHTIELADGRVTPGWVDQRPLVHLAGFADDMSGQRALDCGQFDGFWSFEMERRGAEVVGIDIAAIPPPDIPAIHRARLEREGVGRTQGAGFERLRQHLGSGAGRVICDVRDVEPDRIGGPVDVVFIGSLLLHIRDPLRAIEAASSCLRPGGVMILVEPVLRGKHGKADEPLAEFKALRGGWTYWYPNRACIEHWLRTAGFSEVETVGDAVQRDATGNRQLIVGMHARR